MESVIPFRSMHAPVASVLGAAVLLMAAGCGTEKEEIPVPSCLTSQEADLYVSLARRRDDIAQLMREGKAGQDVWAEWESIAPRLGYLDNASIIRSTASGCRQSWY